MPSARKLALVAAAATLTLTASADAQPRQVVTGPVAVYWMSAQTQSGFGMPGMGGAGAGRPSMSQIMGMMGGGNANHSLVLQLGSSRRPAGEAAADHLPPPGLGAGPTLPLVTPRAAPSQRVEETPAMPQEYQRPRGRMLIFWGCGERARPGQPIVIDFANLAAGQIPPGLAALGQGLNLRPMQPPSPTRNTTYGEWPNERTRTTVPGDGSLIGDHLIRGNYSPEIRFALNPAQDFLAPLDLSTNLKNPTGSALLGWGAVPGAQAYLATAMGGSEGSEAFVLWSSSEVQASAFALPDYISPSDLTRLVASRALMAPATTTCTVPREVVEAAPQSIVQLVAYGGEANFVHPPRPADPKVAWNQEWQVKVRYRSATGGMLGMAMPGMGGPRGQRGAPPPPRGQQPPSPGPGGRAGDILRGIGRLPFP